MFLPTTVFPSNIKPTCNRREPEAERLGLDVGSPSRRRRKKKKKKSPKAEDDDDSKNVDIADL